MSRFWKGSEGESKLEGIQKTRNPGSRHFRVSTSDTGDSKGGIGFEVTILRFLKGYVNLSFSTHFTLFVLSISNSLLLDYLSCLK